MVRRHLVPHHRAHRELLPAGHKTVELLELLSSPLKHFNCAALIHGCHFTLYTIAILILLILCTVRTYSAAMSAPAYLMFTICLHNWSLHITEVIFILPPVYKLFINSIYLSIPVYNLFSLCKSCTTVSISLYIFTITHQATRVIPLIYCIIILAAVVFNALDSY